MTVKSTERPLPLVYEEQGDTLLLRLSESPRRVSTENGEEWEYEEFTLTVPKREDIEHTVLPYAEAWLFLAKERERRDLACALRAQRDALLMQSDWTQGADAPLSAECVRAWAVYRRQLRDLPAQAGFPYGVRLPTPPQKETDADV